LADGSVKDGLHLLRGGGANVRNYSDDFDRVSAGFIQGHADRLQAFVQEQISSWNSEGNLELTLPRARGTSDCEQVADGGGRDQQQAHQHR
jgi:hypothetical protein